MYCVLTGSHRPRNSLVVISCQNSHIVGLNFSTSNLRTHQKDHPPWSSRLHCRGSRMVQIYKSINGIHQINRVKEKTYMIISSDTAKSFDKNSVPRHDKISREIRSTASIPQCNKSNWTRSRESKLERKKSKYCCFQMIHVISEPQNSARVFLQSINTFKKVAGYKINSINSHALQRW